MFRHSLFHRPSYLPWCSRQSRRRTQATSQVAPYHLDLDAPTDPHHYHSAYINMRRTQEPQSPRGADGCDRVLSFRLSAEYVTGDTLDVRMQVEETNEVREHRCVDI